MFCSKINNYSILYDRILRKHRDETACISWTQLLILPSYDIKYKTRGNKSQKSPKAWLKNQAPVDSTLNPTAKLLFFMCSHESRVATGRLALPWMICSGAWVEGGWEWGDTLEVNKIRLCHVWHVPCQLGCPIHGNSQQRTFFYSILNCVYS